MGAKRCRVVNSIEFLQWVAAVRAESRKRYDATPEQMYGREAKRLGQSVRQFYRDWYPYAGSVGSALEEIVTDIELVLETGTGTLDR
jgi:hypothetical protein